MKLRKILFSILIIIILLSIVIYRIQSSNSKKHPIPKSYNLTSKSALLSTKTLDKKNRVQSKIQSSMASYLMNFNNRESVKDSAIKLNHDHQRNSCVYFVSESLRRIGMNFPKEICNTGTITNEHHKNISLSYQLSKSGWKVCKDLSLLLPGDICFTTPALNGRPTHAYIFMGWTKEDSFDSAYVCDNQSYDYRVTLHIRNIKNKFNDKDAFAYFMYLPN